MIRKYLLKLLSFSLAIALCLGATGCVGKEERYKVKFKIDLPDDYYWYYMDDETEVRNVQWRYDGERHAVKLDSWIIPKHPDTHYSEEWHIANEHSAHAPCSSVLKFVEEDGSLTDVYWMEERGHYIFICVAKTPSDLWDYQCKYLHIYYV